jgi:hypothetical protein
MGKAGIALLAVGGAALITGVVLVVRAPAPREDKMPTHVFSTRPPGYALLGVGAAVAITGGVLLGLDRRNAKNASTARFVPTPWIDPGHGGGVGVVGRF